MEIEWLFALFYQFPMITVITSMNVDILNFSGTENHNFRTSTLSGME